MKYSIKKSVCLFSLWFSVILVQAQEPFDIASVDYSSAKIIDYENSFGFEKKKTDELDSNQVDVFSRQSFSFLFNNSASSGEGKTVPALNSSIIIYRLGLFTYKAKKAKAKRDLKQGDKVRVYLPLVILSKVDLDYDSSNVASISDATDFSGSPFTFRLMPSYDFKVGLENKLVVGGIVDFRGIITKDAVTKNTNSEYGIYYSFGLKYSGLGDVRDETGQSYVGKWSISALLYKFNGSQTAKKDLFHTNDFSSGAEFIFKFKAIDTKMTRFNLFANAQYRFDNVGVDSWIFKFGIGN